MAYNYKDQSVVTSMLVVKSDADTFFAPVALVHTGYAFDGTFYNEGVPEAGNVASWWAEPSSATRGPLPSFPTQALILVNRASMAILDATTDVLSLWMLFLVADSNALTGNPQGTSGIGYTPRSVTWGNGLLSLVLVPDPGANGAEPQALTFDFTGDTVHIQTTV